MLNGDLSYQRWYFTFHMFYVNYFQYPQKVIIIINVKNLALCLNIVYIIFLIYFGGGGL